ncbi:5'-nucleotidase [Paraburkholderia aspalathi]|nr:5'-nucleotidase [Paraburkholderia aspalathi]MBK3779848.1 5'-nucleotidase [Paraburkholderia aspalathi]
MLIVAVSSRALFRLEDGHKVYETDGVAAFDAYMRKHENRPLRQGAAFSTVRKLLALNTPGQRDKVDVMLLSSNTLDAGARVMNSIRHYGLDIERAFFTSGGDRFRIAKAANVTLFLSTNPAEVKKALAYGIASASVIPTSRVQVPGADTATLCIAFDGDSVLFGDESERVNQLEGLAAFQANEQSKAKEPLGDGPFKSVLLALHEIQLSFADRTDRPLRVALVTARGVSAYDRVLKTFRTWGVHVDESFFCGGLPKGRFLDALDADIFFDDSVVNVESARQYVSACHVPHGIQGDKSLAVLTAA